MSDPPSDPPTDPPPERIIRIATVLFAEHGFDGVSTREIAAAAGLNVATVNYHVGGKRDLYRAVFARMSRLEHDRIAGLLDEVAPVALDGPQAVRALLRRVAEMLVAMTAEHPETARLWVRRWLEDHDPDDTGVEVEARLPVYRLFDGLVTRIEAESGCRYAGPNVELSLTSVSWMLYGYVLSGPLDWNRGRARPDDPAQLAAFTDFLADYFARMFAVTDDAATDTAGVATGGADDAGDAA